MWAKLLLVVYLVSTTRASWPTPQPEPVISIAAMPGAKADNLTSNTAQFKAAVARIEGSGGGTLFVPAGCWLTGPFNLTSNMTLYLANAASIQASTDLSEWPLMPPMQSYGQGRDHPGPRHVSLLHGFHISSLTIGGENGTVDGGGPFWWDRHWKGVERFTRGHLFECMNCSDILFQDVTFINSPFWTVHPVFSRRVTARRLTVLNDHYSPNTDGFDPDSTTDVLIEDSFFSTGDDGVAIKSGWDCYGVAVGRPSTNITIRNLTVISPTSAGICIGSEMSGGVSQVSVSRSTFINCGTGLRVKTGRDRGGYVQDVSFREITMDTIISAGVMINSFYGGKPEGCPLVQHYPPPQLSRFVIADVRGINMDGNPMQLSGLLDDPTTSIVVTNVSFSGVNMKPYDCRGGINGSTYTHLEPIPPETCGLSPHV